MDYYCTWRTQRMRLDSKLVPPGAAQGQLRIPMRDNLHEGVLFGSEGWVETLYPDVRDRLFFVLDDGWDVPPGTDSAKDRARFGSLIPDAARFPSLEGSPAAKLGRLSERIMAAGWAGLGLWVSPQQQGEDQQICLGDADAAETYWRERARWSGEAGIRYWKVDWGRHDHDLDYRVRTALWAEFFRGIGDGGALVLSAEGSFVHAEDRDYLVDLDRLRLSMTRPGALGGAGTFAAAFGFPPGSSSCGEATPVCCSIRFRASA